METDAGGSRYQVGQVWRYKARLPEIGSTLTIVKIDQDAELGNIIHIGIQNLHMRNPHVPAGFTTDFPHLPLSEEALDESVVNLLRTHADLPDYAEGYKMWRKAFDVQEAGIFTLPVAECIDVIEQTLTGENQE